VVITVQPSGGEGDDEGVDAGSGDAEKPTFDDEEDKIYIEGSSTSHNNTILVFAALPIRILAIRVSSQNRSRSTRLNDRGVRVCFQPLHRASISFIGSAFVPRESSVE
jgi:hypothetical protein